MARWLNAFLLGLIVVVGLPFYWLLIDNRPGDARPHDLSIAELRTLAASIPGPAPAAVEGERAAWRKAPRALFAAGSGIKRVQIAVLAYRLPVPGGKAIMIDSGITAADAAAMGIDHSDDAAQARIERGLREAGLILLTHEHPDHEAALLRLGGPALAAARFNPAQLPGAPLAGKLLPRANGVLPSATIRPGPPQAVAPGVVVIPAASHTPGSQMIYVRLASGREYLFAGDIATLDESWRDLRARSRLVGDFLAHEDRAAVFGWLLTIRKLKAEAPALIVIPGHDARALHADGSRPPRFRAGFSFDPQQ